MPPMRRLAILSGALLLAAVGIATGWIVFSPDRARNTSDAVFSPGNLAAEAVVFLAIAFLIFDARDRLVAEPAAPPALRARRIARLCIAVGIAAVHLTVLIGGGYGPP